MKQIQSNTKFWVVALTMVIMGGLASCKSATEPETVGQQSYDSQAAADMTATAIGTQSGGDGSILSDALSLGKGGGVDAAVGLGGKFSPQQKDSTYDPATMLHTIVFTRSRSWGQFSYTGNHTYTFTYYDASGATMPGFVKGVTDKIVLNEVGGHSSTTPRVSDTASSTGGWTLTGLSTGGTPTVNGTRTHTGTATLNTPWNPGRTITRNFTINYTNDLIKRDSIDGFIYLVGTGNSDLKATTPKTTFERSTQITFNPDETATLAITRTSGDGTVDTYTIDVKQGFWLRDGR